MLIGLIDVDSHNFPNLALMKISAWHKKQGDTVEWWIPLKYYDIVYASKVFDSTYTKDNPAVIMADKVVYGGTGYGIDNKLPYEIEHIFPDYSIYPVLTKQTAYGFLTRGCPNACPFCIVSRKEGRKSVKVADLSEFWNGQKHIKLLDPNILACKEHPVLLEQLAESGSYVDFTQGLDARLLTEDNVRLLARIKTKTVHFAFDLMQNEKRILRGLEMYRDIAQPNVRDVGVYVLTNYNTTLQEDLYRIYRIREIGFTPYVMVYDKPNAPKVTRWLQRWCNNRTIYRSVSDFLDYRPNGKQTVRELYHADRTDA